MSPNIFELIQKLCPDGVEYRRLGEVFKRERGTSITAARMKDMAVDEGDVRVFAGGKTEVRVFSSDIPGANILKLPSVLVQSRGVIDVIYCDEPFTFKNEMWAYTHDNPVSVRFFVLSSEVSCGCISKNCVKDGFHATNFVIRYG